MVPGYEIIQELAHNDWQGLYRGRRLCDQRPVLLKLPRRNPATPAEVAWLARERTLLQELDCAGVPRVLEFLRHAGQDCLVLEDEGGMPLLVLRACGLAEFFKLALPLTSLLGELHRRGIIHQNLNPRSILLDPATGAVWLSDFSCAVRGTGETATHWPPQLLRSSLPYLAPEQTGRMQCPTDYRADFYALGVTFYELLTGLQPFCSSDVLELLHWHIAKPPVPPVTLNPALPTPLSDLVLKLLAKTAEERYQSAAGLHADLAHCAREWAAHGRIAPFTLGQFDISERFRIPEKLYGRTAETSALRAAFERACEGETALLLVGGYAGIGKTSLIQELHKPIVRRQGYFCSGKFDQYAHGVPFDALIQALRGLVRQLLGESETQLANWRLRLRAALGANGGVLAEFSPEIELLLGPQTPPPELGPAEALNRFQMVFQQFVGALADPEHPLVIFLDDLQWADAATLSLLQPLLTTPDIRGLLVLGAYRDHEITPHHPLVRTWQALETAGGRVQRLTLGPLPLPDLTRLSSDTLHVSVTEAAPLAQLILAKTAGNPFFISQFLQTLQQEGFLSFDQARGRWSYELADIAAAPLTDNVIDLMTRKLQRLSPQTQRALTLAACIGNPFDQPTLALISQQTPAATAADLREALHEGLILPLTERRWPLPAPADAELLHPRSTDVTGTTAYAFLHDRMQQAAYALIPPEQKPAIHLAVGRLLRARSSPAEQDERLFDILYQLNLGSSLLTTASERRALARLNLHAGHKARAATAYEAARSYFKTGAALLAESDWTAEYDLLFTLQLEAAECETLCGNFAEAERAFEHLLTRAHSALDEARVHSLRIVQNENLSRYAEALASARAALALFGVGFPAAAADQAAALETELAAIQSLLGAREIAELIELPVMTDPAIRMVMSILMTGWASAYISGQPLLTRLISAMLVRLSLVHGNAEESAYGYATHTVTVGPVRGDYAAAYEFGQLALRVNERFHDTRRRAKIYQQFHAHANFWRQPLATCLPFAREARRSGLETGDFTYGAYGAFTESWVALQITPSLAEFVSTYDPNLALFNKLKLASLAQAQQALLNWARALLGETQAPGSLTTAAFDEAAYVQTHQGNAFFTICYVFTKLQLSYLNGEIQPALALAAQGRALLPQLEGTLWPVFFRFWQGLTLAAAAENASPDERAEYLAELAAAQHLFTSLAEHCRENFHGQALLLAAEYARLTGQPLTAAELYERALHFAEEMQHVQLRALAYELCARFWLQRGLPIVAAPLLVEARASYAQWGAVVKVAQLERHYGDWLSAPLPVGRPRHRAVRLAEAEAGALDIFSVMKAAQTIASEMELSKLLDKLLHLALENAGAERGTLLLEEAGQAYVRAEGRLEHAEVLPRGARPLNAAGNLPLSLVNYVRRTGESVILAEAAQDGSYAHDPYLQQSQARSILCLPVLHQGRQIAVLYLENNRVGGAFTPERVQVIHLLAAQAAISLENARLYEEMRQEAQSRRQAEQTLRSVLEGTAALTGDDFFASLVRHLAAALQVRYAFITECRAPQQVQAHLLAFWCGDRLAEQATYEIAETPCQGVLAGETCHYATGLQQRFPRDTALVELRAESYLGIPLRASTGEVIGHLAVLDDKPLREAPPYLSLLNLFAARAGAELERQLAETELRNALAEVERLKNQLHAENLYLQEEIRHEHNFEEIVGNSPALLELLRQVERIAQADTTVLIAGETGTGKELIARALHDRSTRRKRPLVKINCGAISAGLVESELFGHLKGAFTGALERRIGRFELADGGTLFLDEVGELPLDTQVKLLRVLQEGEFEPVGSSKTLRVDVRIIAATNRDLAAEVRAGRLRADLYYRLNVLPLTMPPLRERQSDIPQLVAFFLARYAKKFGKQMEGVSQETIQLLVNYAWPGNIRELQNLIERGVALAQQPVLTIDRSLLPGASGADAASPPSPAPSLPAPVKQVAATSLADLQRQHIVAVLQQTGGVIEGTRGAAHILKLHPNTLRSRMKKLGLNRTDYLVP
jgi:predicted ATPase/GAF domain-containing protein